MFTLPFTLTLRRALIIVGLIKQKENIYNVLAN